VGWARGGTADCMRRGFVVLLESLHGTFSGRRAACAGDERASRTCASGTRPPAEPPSTQCESGLSAGYLSHTSSAIQPAHAASRSPGSFVSAACRYSNRAGFASYSPGRAVAAPRHSDFGSAALFRTSGASKRRGRIRRSAGCAPEVHLRSRGMAADHRQAAERDSKADSAVHKAGHADAMRRQVGNHSVNAHTRCRLRD
jgi:hypothetical protein